MKNIFYFLVTIVLVSGCATQKAYEGEVKNSNELSQIKPAHGGVVIKGVDGYWLDKLKSGSFETLPGRHTVKVFLSLGPNFGYKTTPTVELIFNTDPGRTYIVDHKGSISYKGDVDPNGYYVVFEKETGKIVLKK